MDISSLLQAILDPRLNRSAWIQEIVKPGDAFNLKIVDIKDDQRVLVDFGKFRALAEVKFPVKPGAEMLVKVTDTDGQLRLQLIDPDSQNISGRKNVFNRLEIISFDIFNRIQSDIKQTAHQILNLSDSQRPPKHIARTLAALNTHFESIDLSKPTTKWLPMLKSYVEDAGFFFEKKVADIIQKLVQHSESEGNLTKELLRAPQINKILTNDLKPVLFMLKAALETPDVGAKLLATQNLSRFKGSLDMLLADILNQQNRAVHKHELPDPYHVFSFALPLKENQQKAKLKFYFPKKKKNGSKNGFKISLLLDMDKIGEIRADFFLLKKELTITFFVNDDTRKIQFEEHLDEISSQLDPLFDYLIIKTVVSEKKIQDFHREDLDLGSDKQIDLRI
ncbi:MAG: hypothetical protein PVI71_13785 [Desulfobacterales bacterium]|jgi:hypothetical protein